MTQYDDMLIADLQFAESEFSQVVTIAGTDYPAIVTDIAFGEVLAVEGLYSDRAISVTLRVGTVARPAISSTLIHRGETFRVLGVRDSADTISYELTCDAVHK